MTTYTVFNIEDEDPEDLSGLTLEAAVDRLLELSGCDYMFRRVDGMMVMEIEPWPWTLSPAGLTSELSNDASAKKEILNRFVTGEAIHPSEWCIVADDVFVVEMAKA